MAGDSPLSPLGSRVRGGAGSPGAPPKDYAQAYEAWFHTPLGSLVDSLEKGVLFPLLGPVAGAGVLEVGAGPGTYSLPLAQRGARVVAVEPSSGMLWVARGKAGKAGLSLAWVRGRAEQLPFRDGCFQRALAVTVLEFLPQPEEALGEMWRTLKPGGVLVVGALNRCSPWHLVRTLQGKHTLGCRPFSPRELSRLLEPYGKPCWRGAIFFPPLSCPVLFPLFRLWERLGRWLFPCWGAFLVFRVEKPL